MEPEIKSSPRSQSSLWSLGLFGILVSALAQFKPVRKAEFIKPYSPQSNPQDRAPGIPKGGRQRFLDWCQRHHVTEFVILAVGLTIMSLVAFVPKAFRQSATVNPEGAGQFGSFIGGVVGAIFALIGVVLLYSTLTSQRRAATQQSFENKYFELIKLHRANVAEIELKGESGRKIFVVLLRELRSALPLIHNVASASGQRLTQLEELHAAYYLLFFGVGPNSSRMLQTSLSRSGFDTAFVNALEREVNKSETKNQSREDRHFRHVPFEGHQSRLGHYYRHLYQMVRYVEEQQMFDFNEKYQYMKTIRAQLSTHEQALLLVNSLTQIGQNWWREDKGKLIVNYRLVQNIPQDFFKSSELDMSKLFPPKYFEWEDCS